jgi:hypothetical protein
MKNLLRLPLLLLACCPVWESHAQIKLHTEDLPRFYAAFDSVLTTTDTARQTALIQRLYVDKASKGLTEFSELRECSTPKWRSLMETNRQELQRKRPFILSVLDQEAEILKKIARFKVLYPGFRDGDIYFVVGVNTSGGTIRDNTVYIGTEVAASNEPNWAVYLVLHEFTHTQQYDQRNFNRLVADNRLLQQYEQTHKNLLGKCIEEGMADFVAELVLEQPLAQRQPDSYIAFGLKYEPRIWSAFRQEMDQEIDWKAGWLYGKRTVDGQTMRDLGYFVGYQICKSYYQRAKDKKKALAYMIELNLTDENARTFLLASGYDPGQK